MAVLEEWNAITARIAVLHDVVKFVNRDAPDVATHVLKEVKELIVVLKSFCSTLQLEGGVTIRADVERVIEHVTHYLDPRSSYGTTAAAISAASALTLLGARVAFVLTSSQEQLRLLSERAFDHLQRLIVVDDDVRKKWVDALEKHETACEALGSVHLLWHGIWAFKAKGNRAETDLVFQDQVASTQNRPSAVSGFVLTEWKLCKEVERAAAKFNEARQQADAYVSGGILGGIELTQYRFAVVVSKKAVPTPADLRQGNVTWLHVNIPVDPDVPSVTAKKSK